jgi:hypothetical protein
MNKFIGADEHETATLSPNTQHGTAETGENG